MHPARTGRGNAGVAIRDGRSGGGPSRGGDQRGNSGDGDQSRLISPWAQVVEPPPRPDTGAFRCEAVTPSSIGVAVSERSAAVVPSPSVQATPADERPVTGPIHCQLVSINISEPFVRKERGVRS